jgi:hypothetical protein
LLRANPDAARRFRETQRLADRLARRTCTPDLSGSILAVVHAKQPFAAPRRRRVSPQRLAFAGGLLAGIALVVVLQSVARAPRFGRPELVARVDQAPAVGTIEERIASVATPRQPLALHGTAKYEAVTSAARDSIQVSGFSGNVDVTGRVPSVPLRTAVAEVDPCSLAASEAGTPSGRSSVAGVLAGEAPVSIGEAGTEWPPADIGAFIDRLALCGVGDEFAQAPRVR